MSAVLENLEKPTLLLNEDAARSNIRRMAEKARLLGARFRPHFKTHQSAEIGGWFRELGIQAITTSSVDMALYFADHGWQDITIAFPANLRQGRTIAALAERVRLGLLVESVEAVEALARVVQAPVDLWIKIDTGAHRTGIAWDSTDEAIRVAASAAQSANFNLRGLLTHAGNTYAARGAAQVCRLARQSVERIHGLRCALQAQGYDPLEVSIGDTPSTSLCSELGSIDEIRPGNFVFYDAQQIQIGACGWQDAAVALACPVTAIHPRRGEAVVYGGAVHLSKDYLMDGERRSYGMVCLPEGAGWGTPIDSAWVSGLSQEHGILHLPDPVLAGLRLGDLLCIIPAHSCLTVTLMKRYLTLDGRTIETMNA